MQLNRDTGEMVLPDGTRLTRGMPLAAAASFVEDGVELRPLLDDFGRLASIRFSMHGPQWPRSWDEWTPAIEDEMRGLLLTWFRARGFDLSEPRQPLTFPWGTLGGYFDFKNGTYDFILRWSERLPRE